MAAASTYPYRICINRVVWGGKYVFVDGSCVCGVRHRPPPPPSPLSSSPPLASCQKPTLEPFI